MKRLLALTVAVALVLVACSSSTTEPVATDPPAATSTQSPSPTSTLASTTTTASTTTSVIDHEAELAEGKELMTQPELSDGGVLEANGAFAESTAGLTPFEDLEILVYDNGEHLSFYVEGPEDLVRELVIEFDALSAGGAPVRDTSYVGDLAVNPPPWAVEAQNGNTVRAADYPPPGATASDGGRGLRVSYIIQVQDSAGSRLGVHIASEISTLEEFAEISIWLYKGAESGKFSYAHYVQLYEELIENAGDGLVVAAFFSGVLGIPPPPAAWFLAGG